MNKSNHLNKLIIEEYDRVIVITDLEPDDLIAITMLLKSKELNLKTFNQEIIFIISAWSNVEQKARFFRKFLLDCFSAYANSQIYLGESSDKKFEFPFEVAANENFPSYQILDPSNSLIINLAPIRELMFYHQNIPNVFKNCYLAIYGSFNIRSVIVEKKLEHTHICNIFYSFSGVLCYESFYAVGSNNNMTDPEILGIIKSNYPYLEKIIKWWNQEIMDDCQNTCNDCDSSSEKYKRNIKVVDAIKKEPYQFVNADTGLIAVLLEPELLCYARSGFICFDSPSNYTQFVEFTDSNIKLIKCDDDSLRLKQIDLFKKILQN